MWYTVEHRYITIVLKQLCILLPKCLLFSSIHSVHARERLGKHIPANIQDGTLVSSKYPMHMTECVDWCVFGSG